MQKFISQIPELVHYLSHTCKKQHHNVVRELILLGIDTVHRRAYEQKQKTCEHLANEISQIKQNLQNLNNYVKNQYPTTHSLVYNPTHTLRQRHHDFQYTLPQHQHKHKHHNHQNHQFNPSNTDRVHSQPAEKDHSLQVKRTSESKECQKKCRSRSKDEKKDTHNPFLKQKTAFRHHLDDTQAREVLHYPADILVEVHHPNKRRSKDYKQHVYQQEINRQEMKKTKLNEKGSELHDYTRRNRSQTDYLNAQSKIKSLLDQDRIRFMQKQKDQSFREGFNKYEYSDQNQMDEQSSFHQEVRQINRSNNADFNQSNLRQSNQASSHQKSKASSKKVIERSRNQVSNQGEANYRDADYTSSKKSQNDINLPMKMKPTIKEGKLYRSKEVDRDESFPNDQDDRISDSSSFSQFSINGSRRKEDIGKISKKRQDN